MAYGAVVVGSDTPPLRDVIRSGENGLLVDFFDGEALARQITAVLADPAAHRHLGEAARASTVAGFDLRNVCLPAQLELVDQLAAGLTPPAPPRSDP
jgi:glycosyltransferase involved in cell wall biosynthesis